MFRKKTPTPTTVAEAIAPFTVVKDNLVTVVKALSDRRRTATKRIEDAQDYVKQVTRDESAAIAAADDELKQAEKIAKALSSILGEEYPSQFSTTDSERAAKLGAARTARTDTGEGLRKGPDA